MKIRFYATAIIALLSLSSTYINAQPSEKTKILILGTSHLDQLKVKDVSLFDHKLLILPAVNMSRLWKENLSDKTRDVMTGKITGFEVYADDLKGKSCIIVDDICDGGGTFAGLAIELRKKGARKVHLIVTHGTFSKGLTTLTNFDSVITSSAITDVAPLR